MSRTKEHGLTNTRLYHTWRNMKQKCYNPSSTDFPHIGGKGIVVCEEWESFLIFREWAMSHGYAENLVMHRKDNNDDYCPDNCKWVTKDEHLASRGKTGIVLTAVINGVEKTLSQISKETGINRETLKYRLLKGQSGEELIREAKKKFASRKVKNN